MSSSLPFWRPATGRTKSNSLICRPTTNVSLKVAENKPATRHPDNRTLLETLLKFNGANSPRARSSLSQSDSSSALPRTDIQTLPGTGDVTPSRPTVQTKPPLQRIVTDEHTLQENSISVQYHDHDPHPSDVERNATALSRSARNPKLPDRDRHKPSALARNSQGAAVNTRTSSLKSPVSSGSSDQIKESNLQPSRRLARSHLREGRRNSELDNPLSPSSGSSEYWNTGGDEVDVQLPGQEREDEVMFDVFDGGEAMPSTPVAQNNVPGPMIRLQRKATVPLVTPDPIVVASNDALHSNTSALLGIPHSNTFSRTRPQGQVSIGPEVKWKSILPTTIVANLHLRFHGLTETTTDLKTFPCFVWYLTDSYEALLAEKTIATPRNHELYLRHACCCVLDTPRFKQDVYYSTFYDEDALTLSHYAIQNICDFIGIYPFHPFTLEIYWDYSSVQLKPVALARDGMHTSLADTMQSEIRRKMDSTRNFEGQRYIARRDLNPFLDIDVVHKVMREDSSLNTEHLRLSDEQRLEFAREIQTLPAVILFAICVYAGLEMRVLWHFVKTHDFSDKILPNTDDPCDWPPCADKIRKICETKPAFFPRRIEEDRRFHKLEKEEVMPLYHAGPNNTKKKLGNGAFGSVYEVGIDPAHTYLSGDPSFRFALKEFSEDPRRREAFNREYNMLKVLANYTDDHIVAPHTFWTHDNKCFILYPKAETSLREFTENIKPPDLGRENVLWFLEQLRGLAEAIDHVHDLNPLPTRTNPKPKETLMWGSHRDIKPENILVFQTSRPVFKIADFGAGEFNPVTENGISKGYPDAPGTPTYWAPDLKKDKKVSRPADMWALGCVYLELLLWYFKFFTAESVEHFSTGRAEFTGADPNFKTNLFWYKKRLRHPLTPVYLLRPTVADSLRDLKKVSYKMRAFERLVGVIRGLLTIDSDVRWKARRLANSLRKITRQAQSDLRNVPDYYSRQFYQNTGGSYQDVKLQDEAINPLVSLAGSTRSASLSDRQRLDSVEGPGPSRLSGSPTSPMLLATGTADAFDVSPLQPPVELSDTDEPITSPPRSSHLEIPRPRSMN